jgi:ureidoglycolate lyase
MNSATIKPNIAKSLAVRPMTAEAFAPYGQLLVPPSRPADIHETNLDYWHVLAEAHFPVRPVWGWLETRQRSFVLSQLERHVRSDEVFIATGGASIMPFALGGALNDPAAQPDLSTLAFFLVQPTQAFVVPKGRWHAPGFPLAAAVHYLILLEEFIPSSDIDTRAVGPFAIPGQPLPS